MHMLTVYMSEAKLTLELFPMGKCGPKLIVPTGSIQGNMVAMMKGFQDGGRERRTLKECPRMLCKVQVFSSRYVCISMHITCCVEW